MVAAREIPAAVAWGQFGGTVLVPVGCLLAAAARGAARDWRVAVAGPRP